MKAGEVVAGRYRLDARLGVGGMGEVWKATHETTRREYAIKFLHAHAATSATARERFTREARVSAKINHPNVIDIFDAGEHDEGTLFLAMELLDGITLADAFHLAPPLSVQDLLTVMHDTARALEAAHAVGIVHRDIKPANVFLHRDRATGLAAAKILDFGISKFTSGNDEHHTKTGAVLGSPRYMSPEQTRSAASVDHRADLWACGVILFEGLTGTWPHDGDSFSSLVVAICTTPPLSIDRMVPDVPEPVRSIVRDALKPVDERIQSAAELAGRLAAAARDPALAKWPLARPLHPPSEAIRSATTGVRIRRLQTTTANDGPETERADPPESVLTTKQAKIVGEASDPETPKLSVAAPPASPPPPAGDDGDDDDSEYLATTPIPPHLVREARARADQVAPLPRPLPAAGAPAVAAERAPTVALPPAPPPEQAQQGQGIIAEMLEGAEPATNPIQKRPFRIQAMTMPLAATAAMPVHPDPLTGTLDTLATTTLREQPGVPLPPPVPGPAAFGALPQSRAQPPATGLRFVAAALSILLLVIIIALVAVLSSTPKSQAKPTVSPASTAHEASPPTPTPEPPPPSAAPTEAEPPAAGASSVPAASEKPKGSPPHALSTPHVPPPHPSKLKQLGSGL